MDIKKTLHLHSKWLLHKPGGVRADLNCSDLHGSCMSYSDLRFINLRGSDLHGSDLHRSDLSYSDLSYSDLSYSDLSYSDLHGCNLRNSNLSGCNLSGSDLSGCNLSGCTGLTSQSTYMQEHFEHDTLGFIVYKTFNLYHQAPDVWNIEPGSIIEEVVNPDRCIDCACGVNVGTLEWMKANGGEGDIWKCRIAWKDAPGIVVPYNTDGKIRAERVELIEVIPR